MLEHYHGKKVLITGHTGFKGSWLSLWLHKLGAEVYGYSQIPHTIPSLYHTASIELLVNSKYADISDLTALSEYIYKIKPDFIFHLAAQALVSDSFIDPIRTWRVNLMGTVNLLEAMRIVDCTCSVLLITSDKCYRNKEWEWGYREEDELGGSDPYSASKACCEIAIRSYSETMLLNSNNVRIASARAGNVIGGGDWSKDRIVPDCMRNWSVNRPTVLRNPLSTRPWQHVLDPLYGYLLLASNLESNERFNGSSYNFGPSDNSDHSVKELVKMLSRSWPDSKWESANKASEVKESNLLKLACDKARKDLGWKSTLNFEETADWTSSWYRRYYEGGTAYSLVSSQINKYMHLISL